MAGKETPVTHFSEGRWLFWGFFVVCPLLFFIDLTRNPYYTQIALLNVLICLYWFLSLGQGLQKKQWVWTATSLDGALGALIVFCFLSWFASFLWHPRFTSSIYSEGSRGAIFLIINLFLAYAAAVRSQDRAFVGRWIWVVYATATAAAIYGICQYFGWEFIWPHSLNPYGNRPVSTFGNPNFMSSYFVVILPVMLADFIFGVTKLPRIFLAFGLLSCVGALLATLTRSSWLGLLIGFSFLLPSMIDVSRKKPEVRNWLIVLTAITLAAILFWPKGPSNGYSTTVLERLAEVHANGQGPIAAISQRFLIWVCAWQMVLHHPFVGNGWGCFELFYPFFQGAHLLDPFFATLRTHANNAHNEILEYWSQVGSIGLGLMFLVWVTFFQLARSLAKRQEGAWRAMHWGLVGGVAGMLVDNLLNVSVHFAVPAFTFWWAVGTVLALDPAARRPVIVRLDTPKMRALAMGAQIVLGCFMVRAGCLWMEEIYFFKGFKISKGGYDLPQAARALQTAYGWHAMDVNNDYELANVLAREGEKEQALYMYGQALDANAGYDEIYFNRATIEAQLGKMDLAERDYRLSLGINPLAHDGYNALGSIYLKNFAANADKVQALYEQGVQAFPKDRDMWNNLGYVYTQRSAWKPAFDAYAHALEIDPNFELAMRNLKIVSVHIPGSEKNPIFHQGEIYQQVDELLGKQKWQEALDRLSPIIQAAPNSFRVHFYLGNIFFGQHLFDKAAVEYRRAAELQPQAATIWQNLGVAEEQGGHLPEAREAFNHVLTLDPKNEGIRQHLAHLP